MNNSINDLVQLIWEIHNHDSWIEFCAIADNTMLFVPQILALYRVHDNNVEGYVENITSENSTGQLPKGYIDDMLKRTYIWGNDTKNYLEKRGHDRRVGSVLYKNYVGYRIDIITGKTIPAVLKLLISRAEGKYKNASKEVFNHDLSFVIKHSRKYRLNYFSNLNDQLRSN